MAGSESFGGTGGTSEGPAGAGAAARAGSDAGAGSVTEIVGICTGVSCAVGVRTGSTVANIVYKSREGSVEDDLGSRLL
jgi:hypothetical protein